jgi:hypothetical protein
MELSNRFVLILVLAAAGAGLVANAARGNAGDPGQSAVPATIETSASASATTATITGEQGVVYFPSQYVLNPPEQASGHVQAF